MSRLTMMALATINRGVPGGNGEQERILAGTPIVCVDRDEREFLLEAKAVRDMTDEEVEVHEAMEERKGKKAAAGKSDAPEPLPRKKDDAKDQIEKLGGTIPEGDPSLKELNAVVTQLRAEAKGDNPEDLV